VRNTELLAESWVQSVTGHALYFVVDHLLTLRSTGCYKITTVFSHAQTVVLCVGCSTVLCQPTGGKCLDNCCSLRISHSW
uniref:40S ribosomal protein S27 n=1 Tax=Callorhinchus milii TaxID=7868 RepID=A0A4W3GF54_CALMI